ncbi:MAG: glycosyltransferase family 4 protein [Candidatus Omnitrophota bacterium]|nr:glycosyltransferase family 4 protein [Candidatus Omnitrophota bacterium]
MKILFIVPYPVEGPSNRFRVEQYLPFLREKGMEYDIRPFCNSGFYSILLMRGHLIRKFLYLLLFTAGRALDLLRALKCDVVFIHREAFPLKDRVFEWLFRKCAKRLIYDFDDAVFLKKPAKTRSITALADQVIAGNRFLKEYAINYNRKVCIIPTCIDTDLYKPGTRAQAQDKVIIGWMGTYTTSAYLASLTEVFEELSIKYRGRIEFRIVGGGAYDGEAGLPFAIRRWHLDKELNELQEFDIGIMPMPDEEWTRGKCAFKIIQYMSVGIPAVASPVGMNSEIIKEGSNGFFASTVDEWCDKLSLLIESPDRRRQMGSFGRKTVVDKYSLKVNGPKFMEVLTNTDNV